MSKLELILNYEGAIKNPENIKKDFKKAMRIILLSFFTSIFLTTGLFLVLYFL